MSNGLTPVSPLQLKVHQAGNWPQIEPIWSALAEDSPYSSFYLGSDWTATWLAFFGELLQPEILLFEDHAGAVGACLLVTRTVWRGPFRLKRVYLNTSGGDPRDQSLMEFNGILCREGYEQAVAQALGARLASLDWDEFVIEGIPPGTLLTHVQSEALPKLASSVSVRHSFRVDLEQLRRAGASYESTLSTNTREQLRRSLRLYERLGPLRTEVADDLASAIEFFEQMCSLHQARWESRGEPGIFRSVRRLAFHRALIRRAFAAGSIHLVRVRAGGETIGILYNFVQKEKVYFFQSGFNYKPDKHLKPGMVTHLCAIRHYLAAGFNDYDFLAGEARYKRSLAKDCRPLAWVVFVRPNIKLAGAEFLRAIKRGARRMLRRKTHGRSELGRKQR